MMLRSSVCQLLLLLLLASDWSRLVAVTRVSLLLACHPDASLMYVRGDRGCTANGLPAPMSTIIENTPVLMRTG